MFVIVAYYLCIENVKLFTVCVLNICNCCLLFVYWIIVICTICIYCSQIKWSFCGETKYFYLLQIIQHRLETWMSSVCLLHATLQAIFVTMWLAHQAMILLSSQVILEMSVFLVQNLTILLTHWHCNKCIKKIERSKFLWNNLFLLASYFHFIQRNWF